MIEIKAVPWRVALTLLFGVGVLLLIYMGVVWLRMRFGYDFVFGLAPLFDLDRSPNVPSWYKALLFVVAAAVSWAAAECVEPGPRWLRFPWFIIAMVMILLSLNEAAGLHEPMAATLSAFAIGSRDSLAMWVFVHLASAAALGILTLPLLLHLPSGTSMLLIASGGIYLIGAVALEYAGVMTIEKIVGVGHAELTNEQWSRVAKDWTYVIEVTIEEVLEMCGPILYTFTVLSYLSQGGKQIPIVVRPTTAGTASVSKWLQPRP